MVCTDLYVDISHKAQDNNDMIDQIDFRWRETLLLNDIQILCFVII